MRAIGLLLIVPVIMWCTQSVLLLRAGLPLRVRINASDLPRHLKRYNRVSTYVAFALVLIGYPVWRGQSPLAYYAAFFPLGRAPWGMLEGFAAAVLYLTLLYLAWLASDNIQFRVRHEPGRLVKRLVGVPFTALLVAFVEELLFRAVLLADLMESMNPWVAVVLGAAIFAGAHYVRSVKRYWTIGGHLGLGLLLCVAFACTHSLWLPMGLHAAGIVMLLGTRPFIRYDGPAWLVGASIFPYAGVAGIIGLALLTFDVFVRYGGP
ncbi:MAG TPA: CPBP family intramembrane metalloprotease [Phycisphaerae bacterium]|nr:CPBP family intramembrane metalloprotease [Phycisphaerae bacterium]